MTPDVNRTGIAVAVQPAVYTLVASRVGLIGSIDGINDLRNISGAMPHIPHVAGAAYSEFPISAIVIIAALMD
jgi:hypothetical protein